MRDSRRNLGVKRKKEVEQRRNRALKKRILSFFWAFIFLLNMFLLNNIKEQISELKIALNRIELSEAGNMRQTAGLQGEIDYVGSIDVINVGRPIERNRAEVLVELEKLRKEKAGIGTVCDNINLYPENMLVALANNPEMTDFVLGYLESDGNAAGGLTTYEKEQTYPLFLQWDPRWGYVPYGKDSNIGLAGCGPTCLSMVLYYLIKDESLTPDKIADYSIEKGYYVEGVGTSWALMEDVPRLYGIQVIKPKLTEKAFKAELNKGRVMICAMGEGDFTLLGHFIVVYGYDDDGFKINDPNCVARSRKSWSFDELEKQINSIWSYSK